MGYKLYVDDDPIYRIHPEGFVRCYSSAEAIAYVEKHGLPEFMDLDHDLALEDHIRKFFHWLGYEYLPNNNIPEFPPFSVHSENVTARRWCNDFASSYKRSRE